MGSPTHISVAALTASSTPANDTTAHFVGNNGASLSVASVTMPNVPSAPMKSFVVSKPAADLRALWRVCMTSPEGRTTVYSVSMKAIPHSIACQHSNEDEVEEAETKAGTAPTHQIQEPLSLSRSISYSVGPRTSRSCHTANRRARSRIEREEQRHSILFELSVEVFPLDSCLDGDVAVFLGYAEDLVHEGHVEGDAAVWLGSVIDVKWVMTFK